MAILIMQPLATYAMAWLTQQDVDLVFHDPEGAWLSSAQDIDALIYYSVKIDKPLMDQLPNLRIIGKRGAGIDTVDLDEVNRREIVITNVGAGGNANSVSEHAISLLFAAVRDIVRKDAFTREGHFLKRFELQLVKEVSKSRMAIVGAGQIGRRLTVILHGGFDCEIGLYDPHLPAEVAATLPAQMFDDISKLFEWAHSAIIAAPLTDQTRDMVGAEELRKLGPDGVLVIVSRGGIVNEQALAAAVLAGDIRAAGTDVYDHEPPADDHPFFGVPAMVLTPHVAGASQQSRDNSSLMVCQQVVALLQGEPAPVVNTQPWLSVTRA